MRLCVSEKVVLGKVPGVAVKASGETCISGTGKRHCCQPALWLYQGCPLVSLLPSPLILIAVSSSL